MTRSRLVRVKRLPLPADVELGDLRYDTVYEVFPTSVHLHRGDRRGWFDLHVPYDSRVVGTLPPELLEDAEQAPAPRPIRQFVDRAERVWAVRQCDCGGRVPGARGDRCLVFEHDLAWRRVWQFPADWASLSDTELEQLSWTT
jgi:hypothetical protein